MDELDARLRAMAKREDWALPAAIARRRQV